MPRGTGLSGTTVRPILAKLDRWIDEAKESGDSELAVEVGKAHDHLHAVRTILRERAGVGHPAQ
jgi:hypothetical protein